MESEVTTPFGDPNADWNQQEEVEYFDNSAAQGHLLIVRVHDVAQYFRTSNNPDGMVHPTRGATWAPFPNSVVRATVADLTLPDEAGQRGKVYTEAIIFPFSLTKVMKNWVGQPPKLLMWRKTGPKQTDPYELINMAGNPEAVAIGSEFLARHPEFLLIPAPEPYIGQPPQTQQQAVYPPPPPNWQPQAQAQAPRWDQPLAPPAAPPAGSFLDSFNQHQPVAPRNHQGMPQEELPPF
jgi:hypothetical protein